MTGVGGPGLAAGKLSVLRYGWSWDRELAATHRLHQRMSRYYDKTGKVMVTSR